MTKKITDFEVFKEITDRESKGLRLSTALVGARTHPGGGIVEMGIDAKTLNDLMFEGERYAVLLYVVDRKEHQEVKTELESRNNHFEAPDQIPTHGQNVSFIDNEGNNHIGIFVHNTEKEGVLYNPKLLGTFKAIINSRLGDDSRVTTIGFHCWDTKETTEVTKWKLITL